MSDITSEDRCKDTAGPDAVRSPAHYEGYHMQARDALLGMLGPDGAVSYWQGCALKYLWRWRNKGGVEDLRKAQRCIEYMVETLDQEAMSNDRR